MKKDLLIFVLILVVSAGVTYWNIHPRQNKDVVFQEPVVEEAHDDKFTAPSAPEVDTTSTLEVGTPSLIIPEYDEWLSYQGQGYSIRYPEGAFISATTTFDMNDILEASPDVSNTRLFKVAIWVFPVKNGESIGSFVNNLQSFRQAPIPSIKEEREVGGKKSIYLEHGYWQGESFGVHDYSFVMYVLESNDRIYQIMGFKVAPESDKADAYYPKAVIYEDIFEKMVESITFTN